MSSSLIIDDNDPSVQYTPLWDLAEGPGYGRSYNLTLHSVRDAGQSVAVAFRGTGIQVVIMREPTSVAGYPVTVYYIDGTYIASIDTPFVPDGRSQSNVTVFTKRDLTQGAHVLNITNMNGTRPSTFWLDYFLVDASSAALNPSSSSTSSSTGMPAATSTSESGTAPSERIAAIAGGVAGALVVIIAAVLGCLWRRRRRRVRKERMLRTNVQPYVPVVRIISQYRTSLHSLEKIPPSPVEGTQSPSVSTPDVRTPRADTDGSRAPSGGALALDTPRSKGESSPLATSITPTPSTADLPRSPVPLLVAEHRHSVRMAAEEAPLRPASGLVLPDELGRALSAASPEVRSGIISFMHSLLQGGPGQQRSGAGGPAGEVDSGMRMYDDDYVPPPQYTTQ
ncbi:hypothetical protein L226DRAFT_566248 [Lentinus tigrinus ALCF2SS1-7]|uniref:Uncharacterized protein n=1 Tax=Lentinus tigrinus ALCF2SS1-6 TaxID=1328759 RepID=A0A5C2SXG4_9APHY|nr:hypothetical protein L227DRAFT_28288 [Lentinus tigrinus ALCF2SS1-6]RPD81484.1 hypothetical protein L226DRAFT_566248 [Lentinus tigrinus ALCF2SS1-7]